MAIYRLKSKIFYTPQEKASYAAGKKAGMQNAQKRMQKQLQDLRNKNKSLTTQVTDLQNKPSGMGKGILVGSIGAIGGTAALNTIKKNSAGESSMGQSETY